MFKESVFKYFIRPKKTIPDGNAELVDGKQVRFIGQPEIECCRWMVLGHFLVKDVSSDFYYFNTHWKNTTVKAYFS